MKDNKKAIQELKNLALHKKNSVRYKTLNSYINGEYPVKITGIGNKSMKLTIFLDYETILTNKNHEGLEKTIYDKLHELPKPQLNTRLGKI